MHSSQNQAASTSALGLADCLELTTLPGFEPGDTLERFGPPGLKGNAWVLRDVATGQAMMETSDPKKVRALNTRKYEAVPVGRHLAELNDHTTAASRFMRGLGAAKTALQSLLSANGALPDTRADTQHKAESASNVVSLDSRRRVRRPR